MNPRAKDALILVLFLVFGLVMFLWGLNTRTVDNLVCVTYANRFDNPNPGLSSYTWVSNRTCVSDSDPVLSCVFGELYLYQRAVVLAEDVE